MTSLEERKLTHPLHEDDVSEYVQQIRRYPLLSAQQEQDLAKACAAGETEAIRKMVNSNLRLVVAIAREYAGRGVPLLDLIQEGSIALIAAARKFDHTKDCRFSTYAAKWIHQGIDRYILNQAGVIRVPMHTMEKMRKLQAVRGHLRQQTGKEPEIRELALQTGFSCEKVRSLLEMYPQVCSLDTPVGQSGEDALQLLLEDLQAPQPYEALVRGEMKEQITRLLAMLPQRQQRTLRLRFGMEDGICHTYEKIARELGVSKERARQITQQAMDKLQKLCAGQGLEEYLK